MKKVDFKGKKFFVLTTLEAGFNDDLEVRTLADVGDCIDSIEHLCDDDGKHIGFSFSVNGLPDKKTADFGGGILLDADYHNCEEVLQNMKRYDAAKKEARRLLSTCTEANLPTFYKFFKDQYHGKKEDQ